SEQSAFLSANARGTQANILDGAGAIAECADVAHADDFVSQHGDAAEKILDRLLRSETDGEAADTQPGERSAHVEAQGAEHGQHGDHENDRFQNPLAQQHERSGTDVAACECASSDAAQGPSNHAPQNPVGADDKSDGRDPPVVKTLQQRYANVGNEDPVDQRSSNQPY